MYSIRDVYKDVRLYFDEPTHKYTDSYKNDYISTTTLLHQYQPKFDKSYWLRKKAKELGISEKELAKRWESITNEACERGTNNHNQLENGIKSTSMFYDAVQHIPRSDNSMTTVADINAIDQYIRPIILDDFISKTENKYPKVYEVFDYYINAGYKIYSEIGVFMPDFLISGTIDVLIVKENQFVIGDWKTNRGGLRFESGYYKKDKKQRPQQTTNEWVRKEEYLCPPLKHIENCNGNIYNLQLSMYAFMVEYILGIPNAGLWLCHIDSDFILNEYGMPKTFSNGMFKIKDNPVEKISIFKMKYLKNEIIEILKDRQRVIGADMNRKTLFD